MPKTTNRSRSRYIIQKQNRFLYWFHAYLGLARGTRNRFFTLEVKRLVNLTSACLNQPSVGSGCKVITQDADNLEHLASWNSLGALRLYAWKLQLTVDFQASWRKWSRGLQLTHDPKLSPYPNTSRHEGRDVEGLNGRIVNKPRDDIGIELDRML